MAWRQTAGLASKARRSRPARSNPSVIASMRAVIQRVCRASVTIDGAVTGAIERGLLILLAVAGDDGAKDGDWLAQKIAGLRIFSDAAGQMNLSLRDSDGGALVVSQFTL